MSERKRREQRRNTRQGESHRLIKPVIAVMLVLGVIGLVVWVAWSRIAVQLAPKKQAAKTRSEAALTADELFWQTFHNGEYDRIPTAVEVLTAAYVQTPNDAVTAAHIAWLHNWRVSERARKDSIPATITDDVMLARRYFREAVNLNPSDARLLGFLAGNTLAEGNLHQDEKVTREGYFMLLDSIKAWPEFNLFTGGYVMSRLPADSPRFREGLEWQWRTLDECIEKRSTEQTRITHNIWPRKSEKEESAPVGIPGLLRITSKVSS